MTVPLSGEDDCLRRDQNCTIYMNIHGKFMDFEKCKSKYLRITKVQNILCDFRCDFKLCISTKHTVETVTKLLSMSGNVMFQPAVFVLISVVVTIISFIFQGSLQITAN